MDHKTKYFRETTICLTREGFAVQEEKNGHIPVEWEGSPLCRVTETGGITYTGERRLGALDAGSATRRAAKATG